MTNAKRNCCACGRVFERQPYIDRNGKRHGLSARRTCSDACAYRYNAQRRMKVVTVECVQCGKLWQRGPVRGGTPPTTCSKRCQQRLRGEAVAFAIGQAKLTDPDGYRARQTKNRDMRAIGRLGGLKVKAQQVRVDTAAGTA